MNLSNLNIIANIYYSNPTKQNETKLLNELYPIVRFIVKCRISDSLIREDVVQDVIIHIHQYSLSKYVQYENKEFSRFILPVIKHAAVNCYKIYETQNGRNMKFEEYQDNVSIDDQNIIDFENKDLIDKLKQQIDDPTTIQIIDLMLDGWTILETSKLLDIGHNTVYQKLESLKVILDGFDKGILIRKASHGVWPSPKKEMTIRYIKDHPELTAKQIALNLDVSYTLVASCFNIIHKKTS